MDQKKVDVVIIGAGLTGLTLGWYLKKAGKKVLLLEKNKRTGGVINTVKANGFTFETGPNTGIIGTPELVELFDDLHGKLKPEIANPKAKNRWIWKGGQWCPLPSGLMSAVSTPLFSLKDKFRILGEPFRKAGNNPYETVDQLVLRRMGKSYLEYAVEPFISGIYAGDPSRLVTRFALPKLYNLEQNYGSFIKGAIRKKKEPKSEIEKRVSREVFSVEGGLKNLTDHLSKDIDSGNIHLEINNIKIYTKKKKFIINYNNNENSAEQVISEKVITTIDSDNLAPILTFLPQKDIDDITNLNYAKVVQAVVCYKKWKGIELNSFGGLVPSKEKRNSLGILFPSSIFSGRAPKEGAILSVFLGGLRRPEIIELGDNDIKKMVLTEIQETLQTNQEPDLFNIYRYHKAIPQYEASSEKRYEAIAAVEKKYSGLILAGNIRDGIGMADRVKQAKQIAIQLIKI